MHRNQIIKMLINQWKTLTSTGIPPLKLQKCKGVNLLDYRIYGNSVQDGTPTPSATVEIESVGDLQNPSGLPDAYMELEYITGDGNQWIDTNYTNTENTGLSVKYKETMIGRYSVGYAGNNDISVGTISDIRGYWGTLRSFQIVEDTTSLHTVEVNFNNSGYTYYDDSKRNWNSGTQTFNKNESINIFKAGYLQTNNSSAYVRIYNVKISEGTSVVRNFVPCYRIADNVIGMYDTINDVFYTNAGTGTFTKGNNLGTYKIPITVSGKNILNKSESDYLPIEYEMPDTYWGTTIFDNNWVINNLKPNTTYTASFDVLCINVPEYDEQINANLGFMIIGTEVVSLRDRYYISENEKKHITQTFTTPSDINVASAGYIFYAYSNRYRKGSLYPNSTVIFSNIQIEEGSTPTDYESYVQPTTTNIYLDKPLYKTGTYADYIDFENQKVVRNIGEITYNGTENWAAHGTVDAYMIDNTTFLDEVEVISNMFKNIQYVITTYGIRKNYNYLYVYGMMTEYPTLNDFKTFLSSNNLYVIGALNTPTEESVVLPNIPSIKGTTIYKVNATVQPSNMYIKYKGK